MVKKLAFFFTSAFLFSVILLFSFWTSLSEDKLMAWCQYQLVKNLPNSTKPVIQDVHTRIWGLEAGTIELKDAAGEKSLIKINNIKIRFDIISILFKQELPFYFELYGGSAKGALQYYPEPGLFLEGSNIVLNWIPAINSSGLIKSNPKLDFNGLFSLDNQSGNLSFSVNRLSISGNKNHTTLSVNLPDVNLDSVQADLQISLNETTMNLISKGDISAKINGKVFGDIRRIRRSKVDLKLFADIKPAYQKSLGIFNNILNSYRSNSGRISIHLTGNLMLPKIRRI